MNGRFENSHPSPIAACGMAHNPRSDPRHCRLAIRRVRGQQERHRRQLPQDTANSRRHSPQRVRAGPRESASSARRWQLLPQAIRTRMALVGDAGYNKDFITAHGIHDAFRDAELCVKHWTSRSLVLGPSTTRWPTTRRTRDRQVLPMYEFTTQLATLEPPPPELQQLLGATAGNQEAMDDFSRVIAGVLSPAEFSPANVESIMSLADAAAGSLRTAGTATARRTG